MKLTWPWARRKPEASPEMERQFRESTAILFQARATRVDALQVQASMQDHRERNHWRDGIVVAMGGQL